jgi:hypothetical protein
MAEPLQIIDIDQAPYTITLADCGKLIECGAGVYELPFGFPVGFYVTFVNVRGGTVSWTTPSANLVSASGGLTLTAQYQSTTIYRSRFSSDWIAMGIA